MNEFYFFIAIFMWVSSSIYFDKVMYRNNNYDKALGILWFVAAGVLLLSLLAIFSNIKVNAALLAPIGIIISAFIASVSLMKSIHSNKKLMEENIKNDKEKVRLYLLSLIKDLQSEMTSIKNSSRLASLNDTFINATNAYFMNVTNIFSDFNVIGNQEQSIIELSLDISGKFHSLKVFFDLLLNVINDEANLGQQEKVSHMESVIKKHVLKLEEKLQDLRLILNN